MWLKIFKVWLRIIFVLNKYYFLYKVVQTLLQLNIKLQHRVNTVMQFICTLSRINAFFGLPAMEAEDGSIRVLSFNISIKW